MGFVSILSFTHKLIEERVKSGETVIDATAGNGVDTAFLARLVGLEGTVHAFDIQQQALEHTAARAAKEQPGTCVELHHCSHAELLHVIPQDQHGLMAAVMFNLGYLPGAAHDTITQPESTVTALEAAAKLLRRGGIITAVLYTGHPGGGEEAASVEQWASKLPQGQFQVLQYRFMNQINRPPYLIAVEKR